MSKTPIQPQDKYVFRMPDGMRDRLKRAAEDNKRSMNAEIVARLDASLNGSIDANLRAFLHTVIVDVLDGIMEEPDPLAALRVRRDWYLSRVYASIGRPFPDPAWTEEEQRRANRSMLATRPPTDTGGDD